MARRILDTSAKFGGTLAADDLAEFAPEWVEPISTDYRGWTVYEMPPNEQGIAALMMLNIVSGYPLGRWGHNSVATLHAMIEAKKLAYADMLAYVADPRFAEVPTKGMISAAYGKSRAALIDQGKANCNVGPGDAALCGLGHHLSVDGRPRRQHGVADPEQFFRLGLRHRGRGRRLRAAQSRRAVYAGAGAPQRAGGAQAAARTPSFRR